MDDRPSGGPLTTDRLDPPVARSRVGEPVDGHVFQEVALGAYLEWSWLWVARNELGTLTRTALFDDFHRHIRDGPYRGCLTSRPHPVSSASAPSTPISRTVVTQFRYELERAAIAVGFAPPWASRAASLAQRAPLPPYHDLARTPSRSDIPAPWLLALFP